MAYKVEGSCNNCGKCCYGRYEKDNGKCPNLTFSKDKKSSCKLHGKAEYPSSCERYPQVMDFHRGNVPEGCGYRVVWVDEGEK